MALISKFQFHGNSTGCQTSTLNGDAYLLVGRGECSFEDKLSAALSSNAKGLIVYNSLQGIYQDRLYASSLDYDCYNGVGYVKEIISPIYGDEMNALIPSSCTANSKCASQRCVVANETASSGTI